MIRGLDREHRLLANIGTIVGLIVRLTDAVAVVDMPIVAIMGVLIIAMGIDPS